MDSQIWSELVQSVQLNLDTTLSAVTWDHLPVLSAVLAGSVVQNLFPPSFSLFRFSSPSQEKDSIGQGSLSTDHPHHTCTKGGIF